VVARAFPRTSPALSPERANYGPMRTLVERYLREIVNHYWAIARRRWEIRLVMSDGIDHSTTDQRPEPIVQEGSPAEIALHLLAKHLSPEQLREMDFKGGFTVKGGKTGVRYLIRQGRISNVYVLDKHGYVIANMCFGPAARQNGSSRQELPDGDVMLAQKIALEDPDLEPEALRVANIRSSRPLRAYSELKTIASAIRDTFVGSSN
jgi:hypothetical protein